MPSFETTRRIAHSAADMFALVADVEQYPKFVPLCDGLRVMKREAQADGEMIIAYMTVAYKLFSESFTSRVQLKPAGGVILVEYLDGPFRRLEIAGRLRRSAKRRAGSSSISTMNSEPSRFRC